MFRISNLFFFLLLISFSFSCSDKSDKLEEFSWITNKNWRQVNYTGNMISLENWSMQNNELIGKGYTIRIEIPYDTVFSEQLKIINKDDQLYYVSLSKNQEETLYKLTSSTENSWTFSNPKKVFPQYITYTKTVDGFTAIVGDTKRQNELNFEVDN